MKQSRKLQSGFTTGTCAAAAAKAAARILLSGERASGISLVLPGGDEVAFPVAVDEVSSDAVSCSVKKDAGDDPDVTNGAMVYARVSRLTVSGLNSASDGALPAALADKPCFGSEEYPFLFLTGGAGIGIVTKKGLSCEPGYYAINPVPRTMIFRETAKICLSYPRQNNEVFLIEVWIPDGVWMAEKTFNPQLGIRGGISILGTTGIVNPMSTEALKETIRLEISVKAAEGKEVLAVAPGNYGETFLKESLGISMEYFIKCSNFIGDTFLMLREAHVSRVLLVGHIGKLIKVAGGVLNTHSAYGDRRMEILSDCGRAAGFLAGDMDKLLMMNTTEEATAYLRSLRGLDLVTGVILRRIQGVLFEHSSIIPEIVLFSGEGMLGMTDGVMELVKNFT